MSKLLNAVSTSTRCSASSAIGCVERRLSAAYAGGLAVQREVGPRAEHADLVRHVVAHEVGERLVEPGVLPPLHRHEVAEPHVRHLVRDHRRAVDERSGVGLTARDVLVAERHAAGSLERSPVVAGLHHLVVGVERVGLVERIGVEVEARLGHVLHVREVAVELGRQRPADVPAERQAGVLPGAGVPRPGAHDEQVRRDRRRRARTCGRRRRGRSRGRWRRPSSRPEPSPSARSAP